MFARAAAAPCAAAQFARARRETGRLARGSRSRAKSGRRASPSGVDVTPRAVSIYDKVRGDDEPPSTVPDPASVPDRVAASASPAEAPAVPRRARPTVRAGAPVVAPEVISSKAAMLASAEDLAGDCDADGEDAACFSSSETDEEDGIVRWTVKYVDKALDDIEREKPAAAGVAWRLNKAGERVAKNPTVRRGAKLTADVSLEVLKVGVKAAAPVVGNIGTFAAKRAFGAALSGIKNPLDTKRDAGCAAKGGSSGDAKKSPPSGEKKKKKIVKLTAAEAEARRKAGKTVRKVEKKRGGFFGM